MISFSRQWDVLKNLKWATRNSMYDINCFTGMAEITLRSLQNTEEKNEAQQ